MLNKCLSIWISALGGDSCIVIDNQCKKIPQENMDVALEYGAKEYDLEEYTVLCLETNDRNSFPG